MSASSWQCAKFACFAALLFAVVISISPLHAQRGAHGPNPDHSTPGPGPETGPGPEAGPGPGHRNRARHHDGNYYGVDNLAYYGDWNSTRVFIIDIDDMSLLKAVEDTGEGPYGVDQQDASTAYALTRKTESVTVIENYFIENIGKIYLDHKPRSTNYNHHTGLSLVSGADKVMTSIIHVDSDSVTDVVGVDEPAIPHDFGGSLATGHPLWIDHHRFFMLNRADRRIELWSRYEGLLSVMSTSTSVHHIFQSPPEHHHGIYYAVVEGNRLEGRSPSILRFSIHHGRWMTATGEAILSEFAPGILDPEEMGSHHAAFHPDGVHIYVGSAEGHVFVVNKNSMQVETMIQTGWGSGHTTFVPSRNLAFVTNHNDTFMTVIDTIEHRWLTDIEVASSASPDYKSQAHTSGVSPDERFFYSAASHDGVFFEIDTETLEVSRTLDLDLEFELDDAVNILMGSFIWGGDGDGGGGM